MSYAVGLDLGSTWSKQIRLVDGEVTELAEVPSHRYVELLSDIGDGPVGACGYFRDRVPGAKKCTEVTAALLGSLKYIPGVEVVIDVGGQDVKVIDARTHELRMNDKCAAGTGAFLEFACSYLGIDFDELGKLHEMSESPVEINETCGVFALSAIVSALADGSTVADVVSGLHRSFARRVAGMVPGARRIAMIGGVAMDSGAVSAMSEEIGQKLEVSPYPQHTNAIGAAIFAIEKTG